MGLAHRFSQSDPQAYDAWFKVLIQKDWGELKNVEFWASASDVTNAPRQMLNNAAIIPRLFRENPQIALQALQEYGCQNQDIAQGFTANILLTSTQWAFPSGVTGVGSTAVGTGTVGGTSGGLTAGGIGIAVVGGIILAIGGLILWDELTSEQIVGENIVMSTLLHHSHVQLKADHIEKTCVGSCPSGGFDHCRVDRVDSPGKSSQHYPYSGDHVHIYNFEYNFAPYPVCQCFVRPIETVQPLSAGGMPSDPPCSPGKTIINWG